MANWKSIIDKMHGVKQKSAQFMLELVNYQYGYIAWCVGNQKNDEAKKYLALAENYLLILEKRNENLSMVNAYKSAFYGYRIGMNKLLATTMGRRSVECANLAIKQNKENPYGYIQSGNIQFYMPPVFGGSKKEALVFYLKALSLMEKDAAGIVENWNYLNLLISIALSYTYVDDYPASISYLEKILRIEPGFSYVKSELYPHVLNKMKNNP
jgi:tetratricopeptide (TPR) repeat protein